MKLTNFLSYKIFCHFSCSREETIQLSSVARSKDIQHKLSKKFVSTLACSPENQPVMKMFLYAQHVSQCFWQSYIAHQSAQRASYLALHSSLIGPVAQFIMIIYIVSNSVNWVKMYYCIPNGAHTNHCWTNSAHTSKHIKNSDVSVI